MTEEEIDISQGDLENLAMGSELEIEASIQNSSQLSHMTDILQGLVVSISRPHSSQK
jgi:hypothetical protein